MHLPLLRTTEYVEQWKPILLVLEGFRSIRVVKTKAMIWVGCPVFKIDAEAIDRMGRRYVVSIRLQSNGQILVDSWIVEGVGRIRHDHQYSKYCKGGEEAADAVRRIVNFWPKIYGDLEEDDDAGQ